MGGRREAAGEEENQATLRNTERAGEPRVRQFEKGKADSRKKGGGMTVGRGRNEREEAN